MDEIVCQIAPSSSSNTGTDFEPSDLAAEKVSDTIPTSSTKRGIEVDDLDQALDALANKFAAVNTNDHEELVARLVEIFRIDPSMATFYLEASKWNINDAVALHVENSSEKSRGGGKRPKHTPKPQRYRHAAVTIVGLPEGWAARVCSNGRIMFCHEQSGWTQYEVPPGFADVSAPSSNKDPSNGVSKRVDKEL